MIYEQRTYLIPSGKLGAILDRFRDHSMALLKKHGIDVVGFWTTHLGDRANGELMYICEYEDLAAREAAWATFVVDPDWVEAKRVSELAGPIVDQVNIKILKATDFSPIQ